MLSNIDFDLVRSGGVEPPTSAFAGLRSIQLNYDRTNYSLFNDEDIFCLDSISKSIGDSSFSFDLK